MEKKNTKNETGSSTSPHSKPQPLPPLLTQEAIKSITRDLGHEGIGAEIVSLWLEYEDQSTPEARVVKDFDK